MRVRGTFFGGPPDKDNDFFGCCVSPVRGAKFTPYSGASGGGWLSDDGRHDPASRSPVAEFAEVDALPDAQSEASADDRKGEADAREGRFGVRRHVVVAFERVGVVAFAFADQPVEDRREVLLHVGVGVLVDRKSRRGVLDKEVQKPRLGQRRQVAHHLVGDEVEPPAARTERELRLSRHRFGRSLLAIRLSAA